MRSTSRLFASRTPTYIQNTTCTYRNCLTTKQKVKVRFSFQLPICSSIRYNSSVAVSQMRPMPSQLISVLRRPLSGLTRNWYKQNQKKQQQQLATYTINTRATGPEKAPYRIEADDTSCFQTNLNVLFALELLLPPAGIMAAWSLLHLLFGSAYLSHFCSSWRSWGEARDNSSEEQWLSQQCSLNESIMGGRRRSSWVLGGRLSTWR